MIDETTTTPPPAPTKKPRKPRAPKPLAEILTGSVDAYHARPEFSATTAKTLIAQSPLHAKTDRETPREPSKTMDRGSIIHALVLGKGAAFTVIDAEDWRKKEAQAQRDEARAKGLIPVLVGDFADYTQASAKIRAGLDARGLRLDGHSEIPVRWTEQTAAGPLACRGMLDHVWLDRGRILDLKITADASPGAIERNAEAMGYALQAAAYTRLLAALRPELAGRIEFLFAFAEPDAPHAINVVRPDGMFRELGERRWLRACEWWAACLKTNTWPGYGIGVNTLSAPAWALAREAAAE
jgi:hypothetical protein